MMYERRLEGSLLKIRKELREQQKRRLAEKERQRKEVNQRDSELKNWTDNGADAKYYGEWDTDDAMGNEANPEHNNTGNNRSPVAPFLSGNPNPAIKEVEWILKNLKRPNKNDQDRTKNAKRSQSAGGLAQAL